MTNDEIIRMAREAGFSFETGQDLHDNIPALERFAALVAAHETKENLKMLEKLREETKAHCLQGMAEAYEMGKQDEREACAKVADGELMNTNMLTSYPPKSSAAWNIAAAIRARGNHA